MVRIRENAESIALYRGEQDEERRLRSAFARIFETWWSLMNYNKRADLAHLVLRPGRIDLSLHRRRAAVFRRRGSSWAC